VAALAIPLSYQRFQLPAGLGTGLQFSSVFEKGIGSAASKTRMTVPNLNICGQPTRKRTAFERDFYAFP
jgi:hypothetical protein